MPVINDKEFGPITVRKSALARYVRLKIGPGGELSASLPKRAPMKLVTQLLDQSRDELRKVVSKERKKNVVFESGMQIGKSHTLAISEAEIPAMTQKVSGQTLQIAMPLGTAADGDDAQMFIRNAVRAILRREAKAYLPRRVQYLAETHGFAYSGVRFNNARTRWGSCSNSGSLNLNIALMQLPHELIDYVIIHELCHTRHLNHSSKFWQLVAEHYPDYKTARNELRTRHPYI
jgi:predicted metal-dependent hydrolase